MSYKPDKNQKWFLTEADVSARAPLYGVNNGFIQVFSGRFLSSKCTTGLARKGKSSNLELTISVQNQYVKKTLTPSLKRWGTETKGAQQRRVKWEFSQSSALRGKRIQCCFLSSIAHLSRYLSPSQVDFSSGRGKANGHIICRLVPPRRLGGCEVIPSLLLPSTSGIYHFIIAVGEEGERPRHLSFPPSIFPSFDSSIHRSFQCKNQPWWRS